MSKVDDGGPAFPCKLPNGDDYEGMSLRDWFGGLAMKAQVSSDKLVELAGQCGDIDGRRDTEIISEAAYKYADAMLVQRQQGPE